MRIDFKTFRCSGNDIWYLETEEPTDPQSHRQHSIASL